MTPAIPEIKGTLISDNILRDDPLDWMPELVIDCPNLQWKGAYAERMMQADVKRLTSSKSASASLQQRQTSVGEQLSSEEGQGSYHLA